jgi:hypothetical protein
VVSSPPRLVVPSSLNSTTATPTLSEAVAETVTAVPETVAPLAGAVRETVGGVVSEGAVPPSLMIRATDGMPFPLRMKSR